MSSILLVIQLAVSILLAIFILMQNRGEGLSGAIGGAGGGGEFFSTRRGAEKILFRGTVLFAVLFAVNALVFAFWDQLELLFI